MGGERHDLRANRPSWGRLVCGANSPVTIFMNAMESRLVTPDLSSHFFYPFRLAISQHRFMSEQIRRLW